MKKVLPFLCVASVLIGSGCAPSLIINTVGNSCSTRPDNPSYKLEFNNEARRLNLRPGRHEAFDVSLVRREGASKTSPAPASFTLNANPSYEVEVDLFSQTLQPNGEAARVHLSARDSADAGQYRVVFRAVSEDDELVVGCVVVAVEEA